MSVSTALICHGGYTYQWLTRTALILEGISSPSYAPMTAPMGRSAHASCLASLSLGRKRSSVVVEFERVENEKLAAELEVTAAGPEVIAAVVVEADKLKRRAS